MFKISCHTIELLLEHFAEFNSHLPVHRMAEFRYELIRDVTKGRVFNKIVFTRKKTYGYREWHEVKRMTFLLPFSKYEFSLFRNSH